MLKESGAPNIEYDYFSTNGQMARELKRSIKEKSRLVLALELLRAVNCDAFDRGRRREEIDPPCVEEPPKPGEVKLFRTKSGRQFKRTWEFCPNRNKFCWKYRLV